MPSVVVSWQGKLWERERQATMIELLERVAQRCAKHNESADGTVRWAGPPNALGPVALSSELGGGFAPPDLELFGMTLPLYETEYRMDLVFARTNEASRLDGQLVRPCARQDGTLELMAPSLTLRYFLEEWTDSFLSWIKFFFIPDLTWTGYYELRGWPETRAIFEARRGDATHLLETLLTSFDVEFEMWSRSDPAGQLHKRAAVERALHDHAKSRSPGGRMWLTDDVGIPPFTYASERRIPGAEERAADIATIIPQRHVTRLRSAGVTTIGDLLGYSPRQLLGLRNVGFRMLRDVRRALDSVGLRLRDDT